MTQTAPSVRGLISELGHDISTLFRNEVELAKAEASEKLTAVAVAVGAIAVGLVLALCALIVLLQAVVIALTALGLPAGASALIVGLVTALTAFAFVKKGVADLKSTRLAPTTTLDNLERDAETIKEHTP